MIRAATGKTIGLWHETTPSGTWGGVTDYQTFLVGDGNNNLGFIAYATDYVNFIANLQKTAQNNGFDLGPIYFLGGDPGYIEWQPLNKPYNNAFKYLMPNPAPGQRPMINQYVVEPLAKLGVRQLGLVVTLNSWNGSKWINPWNWVPNSNDPSPPTDLPTNYNTSAIVMFKLIYELNQELQSSYTQQNTPPDKKLYITLLGFDNEGFSMVPPPNTCAASKNSNGVSSGVVANMLWPTYISPFSNASTPQWGITGQSPPFDDFCDNQGKDPVTGSHRQFAFIEYYNVPDESNPVYTADHPGFVPCPAPWTGKVVNTNQIVCDDGTKLYYQIAYGVVTPSFSSTPVAGLKRNISTDDPATIYKQSPINWSDIWNGITNSEVWQRTHSNVDLSQTFIQGAYSMLNTNNNLTTLSQSSLYCTGCNAGQGTPIEGAQWMLSIENFSSSYQTLKNTTTAPAEYISADPKLALVNTVNPFSSIALKYGPGQPFDITPDKTQYILSHPLNSSGTFEAFGGWGLNNLVKLMDYMNQQNPLLNNFMIYEYAFVQLNDTYPPSPG